jgi:hypothetical protein
MRIGTAGNCRITAYNGTTGSPSESADWPTPALAIRTYDNYYRNSVMSFGYAGDSEYQTGNNVWNIRLNDFNNTYNVSTSSPTTDLELLGPGNLLLGAGTGPKVKITTAGVLELGVGNNTSIIRNTKAGDDIVIDNSVNGGIKYQADSNGHTFKVYDGAWKNALVVNDNGYVLKEYNPYCWVRFNYNKPAGWIPLIGSSIVQQIGGSFWSTANNRFTVPVGGRYMVTAGGYSSTASASNHRYAIGVTINGSMQQFFGGNTSTADTPLAGGVVIVDVSYGDYIGLEMYSAIGMNLSGNGNHAFYLQITQIA